MTNRSSRSRLARTRLRANCANIGLWLFRCGGRQMAQRSISVSSVLAWRPAGPTFGRALKPLEGRTFGRSWLSRWHGWFSDICRAQLALCLGRLHPCRPRVCDAGPQISWGGLPAPPRLRSGSICFSAYDRSRSIVDIDKVYAAPFHRETSIAGAEWRRWRGKPSPSHRPLNLLIGFWPGTEAISA